MSATVRLVSFAFVLVAVFGVGWALGSAVGPIDHPPATTTTTVAVTPHGPGHGGGDR
jgi:hypothetical protein